MQDQVINSQTPEIVSEAEGIQPMPVEALFIGDNSIFNRVNKTEIRIDFLKNILDAT
jgi:hypothetical protein